MIRNKLQELVESLPVSPERNCSYYPDRPSRIQYLPFEGEILPETLQFFFDSGFRRTGNILYRTSCGGCTDCLSYRIPLEGFEPSSNKRRLLKRNGDLELRWSAPKLSEEKETLYLKYQRIRYESFVRHESDPELLRGMRWNLFESAENSVELTIRLGSRLLGFMILDHASDSLSAVYSVYDPEETKRGLGSFAILRSILYAKESGMKYFHLGYFLPGHPDMDYKRNWTPAEIKEPNSEVWIPAEEFRRRFPHFSW
ncbi:arginyltransferase [Leptospira ellisii]|uniref:Arginyltransferase n=2 Tax=Leptospira ellisii TaxID=2023197 RepID=A0A2N0B3R4_9LEPT|nr:arginyltransferase [Leptospira ellisii]MDV6234895.1 arginyltransferase [Leptospira ellisii]PJZ91138.1 arginyltransferase [Leptospira ellisii]